MTSHQRPQPSAKPAPFVDTHAGDPPLHQYVYLAQRNPGTVGSEEAFGSLEVEGLSLSVLASQIVSKEAEATMKVATKAVMKEEKPIPDQAPSSE